MPKLKRWEEIIARVPHDRPIRGAEIGVWRGDTSHRLLSALPQLTLYLVDRWTPPEPGDSFYGSGSKIAGWSAAKHRQALAMTKQRVAAYGERAIFLVGDSDQMAEGVEDESLDFIFVDGDHSYDGVTRDLRAWYPKVREGGIIGGHDIDRPEKGQVTEAVEAFFPGADIERGDNTTWWTTKPGQVCKPESEE